MKLVFQTTGVIGIIFSALAFISVIGHGDGFLLMSTIFGFVGGFAFIALGDLLDRVKHLEEKIGSSALTETDDNLPKVMCAKCGSEHDFDYPRCPVCNHTIES